VPAIVRVGLSVVTILSIGAMGFIATNLLAPPGEPFNATPSSPVSLALGWMILFSAAIGFACLATERHPEPTPQSSFRVRRRWDRVTHLGTVAFLLVPLTAAVLVNDPTTVRVDLGVMARRALATCLWCALAVSLVLVVRAQSVTSRPVRAMYYCAPTVLLLMVSALTLITSRSVLTATLVVSDPVAALGLVGLIAVPAVLLYTGVDELRDTRQHAARVSAVVERRPWLTMAVLALKLAVIVALSLAYWSQAGSTWPVSGVTTWLSASGIGVLMVGVFVLDHRVQVRLSDHGRVSQVLGAVLAVALGSLVVWAVLATFLQRPLGTTAVGLLLGAVCVCRHRLRTARLWVSCPVAILVGTSLSFGSAIPWPGAWSAWHPPSPTDPKQVGVFLAVVIASCTVGLIVWTLMNKSARLLLHFAAIVAWIVLSVFVARHAHGLSLLDIDIVILVLATVAAVTWLARRQTQLDGFEIVALAVVTFIVWEVPLILQLVPSQFAPCLLFVTAMSPGAVALGGEARRLITSRRPSPDWRRLGTICVLYALLSAMVWIVGVPGISLIKDLGSLLEAYLLVPLALLLLISASADHVHVTPSEIGRG
jgi:hypothetical protein